MTLAELAVAPLVALALLLIAANVSITVARLFHRPDLARRIGRSLSPLVWALQLGGEENARDGARTLARERRRVER